MKNISICFKIKKLVIVIFCKYNFHKQKPKKTISLEREKY